MIEKEYKFLMSSDDFFATKEKMKKIFPNIKSTTHKQTNHYFDTENFELANNFITVRIREIEGKYFLQTKQKATEKGNLRVTKETEIKINSLPNTPITLKEYDIDLSPSTPLSIIGSLSTTRTTFWVNKTTHIDFDENEYLGEQDWEIEIEFSEDDPTFLIEKLNLNEKNFNIKGKYTRFLDKVKSLKTN